MPSGNPDLHVQDLLWHFFLLLRKKRRKNWTFNGSKIEAFLLEVNSSWTHFR
jgi:hypothetical protein